MVMEIAELVNSFFVILFNILWNKYDMRNIIQIKERETCYPSDKYHVVCYNQI